VHNTGKCRRSLGSLSLKEGFPRGEDACSFDPQFHYSLKFPAKVLVQRVVEDRRDIPCSLSLIPKISVVCLSVPLLPKCPWDALT